MTEANWNVVFTEENFKEMFIVAEDKKWFKAKPPPIDNSEVLQLEGHVVLQYLHSTVLQQDNKKKNMFSCDDFDTILPFTDLHADFFAFIRILIKKGVITYGEEGDQEGGEEGPGQVLAHAVPLRSVRAGSYKVGLWA